MGRNPAEQPTALLPLRGLRFRPDLNGGLGDVIGPPADIESSAEARAYVRDKPYNAVRLEIEDDESAPLRFTHARELLDRWQDEGALDIDERPSYYLYEQEFAQLGQRLRRRGLIGLVPLDAPNVCVLPHEETWEENRQRRLQILRDLGAAISPIYLIYEGRGRREQRIEPALSLPKGNREQNDEIGRLLDDVAARRPDAKGSDAFGNRHRLWVVSEPGQVATIERLMRGRQFIIADGHHRFEAARLFHREHDRPHTGLILACCVEASDPGIVIRPIHRVVSTPDAPDWDATVMTLARWFEIETQPVAGRSGSELQRSLGGGELPEVGILHDGGRAFTRLRLRSWAHADPLLPHDIPETARHLDVTVVTELVMRRALGIDQDEEPERVHYVNDADEALAAVRDRAGTSARPLLAVLMRPVRLEQVLAVARAGGRVPAKSTSFVPKVPVGLVMHQL